MAPTRPDAKKTEKRRGRPAGSKKSTAVTKATTKPDRTRRSRKGNQASHHEDEDELSIVSTDQTRSSQGRKRKGRTEDDVIAKSQPKSRNNYVQLESRTKRIPQSQIDTWPQVPPQVLEHVTAVIRDAKKDIANAQRDERRVMTAHNTLNPLVKKLSQQLATSRMPPQAKDVHFNIDKLTERNTQVSREVTTARHSKQLLAEQVKAAQKLLDKDEDSLEQLKRNTKKWRAEWKHQEKRGRIHPLLQGPEDNESEGDGPDDINLKQSVPTDLSLDTPDAELAPVLAQLRRSLENMQGNHAQVKGIDEALSRAQAALDDVLFRHASAVQYAAL
ncbi:hypothetical protein T440DRAFT_469909 [Plenodomus tracheiphilus IPT5]|uniref:CENP-Q, a CENPA-CAD centromere complex subunit-domain-containing protein n=1 Tax=Plenodomus tracheiphilus IPT5 TaxID=1408161 RepID=A0A6A7B016_9PLEO|nr:hypothetical protein T440DRAFT_469909 [Plenodomus tracheiphilus IPT5]